MSFIKKKNIPNYLTILRFILIPLFVITFLFDSKMSQLFALVIFVTASVTDFLDGYLARLYNASSEFGRVCDPIADKLLINIAVIMLIYIYPSDLLILISSILVVARELIVSGVREFVAITQSKKIEVMKFAQYKTALQMSAISVLIAANYLFPSLEIVGKFILAFAVGLTVCTGAFYLKKAYYILK